MLMLLVWDRRQPQQQQKQLFFKLHPGPISTNNRRQQSQPHLDQQLPTSSTLPSIEHSQT